MSVIIRLQGLSWSASAMDIRNFFKGLSIPPGGVRIIGGDNGDAFIAFSTDEDARQAMMLTNKTLNDCPVQLFLSSKTEMQNTITQAKVKTPAVTAPAPAPAPTPVTSSLGVSVLNQIPSVQQISQAFPAVGQIMGQLGLQQPAQMNQYQGGLQSNTSQANITTSAGFLNNINMNSSQTVKDKTNTQYEQELPGEYSVGGMQSTNKPFGDRSNTQRQYGHIEPVKTPFNNTRSDTVNRGLPPAQSDTINRGFPPAQSDTMNRGFPPLQSDTMSRGFPPAQSDTMNRGFPPAQSDTVNCGFPPTQSDTMNRGFPPAQSDPMNRRLPPAHTDTINRGLPQSQSDTMNRGFPPAQSDAMNRGFPPGQSETMNRVFPPAQSDTMNHGFPPGQSDTMNLGLPPAKSETMHRGFPPVHQSYENTTPKDQFRGEVYFPPSGSQNHPWESNYRQQNLNQNNQNMSFGNKLALGNQSSNLSGQAGHGKAFHGDQVNLNNQQYGHGKPFQSDIGMNNQQSYQNEPSHTRQNVPNFPKGNQPSEFSIPSNGQSNQNFPPTSRHGDSSLTPVSQPGASNISPRSRQSRFGPAIPPNETSYPPRSRPDDSGFSQTSKPNDQFSTNSPTKATNTRPAEAREKLQPVKALTEAKTKTPTVGLVLSNKRDEFGRNVPYSARDGNLSDSSRTPTQDEKYDDNRSSENRSRDSNRRSSRDREKSRDRSNRRDSPRDRDRRDRDRDRDRGRRERDDDRRPRRDRDREKDRDRDRKPRDRDSDRYERSRESKDIDRKNSPATEANRKARKRSLSPSSKNKNDNEKKLQIEKTRQLETVKLSDKKVVAENRPKTSVATPVSVSQSPLPTDKPASSDERISSTGSQPLFPVIPPPNSGKGLLGEAPANLAAFTSTSFANLNVPPPPLNNLSGLTNTSFRNDGPVSGSRGAPLLKTPTDAVLKDPRGPGQTSGLPIASQGRIPLLPNSGIPPPLGMEIMPSDRNMGQGRMDQPQTFEYGHSGAVMGQTNRDITFDNRQDFRGPGEEPLGLGRGMPPPPFMDDQQRPGFNRGPRGRVDGPQRSFNDPPVDDRNRDGPFDDRRPRDFRGPPQGHEGSPERDFSDVGFNQPPYGERNMDFPGREGRRGISDDGAPRDFRGVPRQGGFRENPMFNERDVPTFQGAQRFQVPYDDRRAKDTRGMPSLLDDIPFGGRRDLQVLSGRDAPRGRNDQLPDLQDGPRYEGSREHDFRDGDDHNLFGSSFRDDRSFDGRDGSVDFLGRGSGDRGQPSDRGQREIRGPEIGIRDYQSQDFDRVPGHMRDSNMGPPNSRDTLREDDRNRMQSERDRDRRTFDRDGPSIDRDRSGFDRRERHDDRDNRDNRSSARYQDNKFSRDRSNERTREDRTMRDDRNREQYGGRNERVRQSSRDDRKDSESGDRRSNRGDDRSSERKSSTNNIKTDTKDKESESKKEDKECERNTGSMGEKSTADVPKGSALCSVVLENIPVETTYKEIRKLFAGLELPKDGIKIINDQEGKRIGKAYVRFGSQESFKNALKKDRTRLRHKVMVIRPVAKKEFDAAIDSYLPPSEDDDDDDGTPGLDMCNSLSATLRALKGEPNLKIQKKNSSTNTNGFVVKLTSLPEYTKPQNIKTFFNGLNIAKNGDAIYIEPGPFSKPCSGLCYVEFADENSHKKALNHKKIFERKTINITQGNKKDAEVLIDKMKKDSQSKSSDNKQESKNVNVTDKLESKNTVTNDEHERSQTGIGNNQNKSSDSVKTSEVKKEDDTTSAEISKTQIVNTSSVCTCLRIQNIPKGMKVFELRGLFETLRVSVKVAQICHDAVGKPIGEGYVELPSFSDVQKCLVKNNSYLGKNKITVEAVTKTEMIDNMRLLRQSLQPETPTTKAVYFFVKAANLPKSVSTGEIMNFFSGFNPAPESIRLNIGDGTEPQDCSTALVGFRTREEAETAIGATNGNMLRNKNVALTKVIL